MRFRASLLPLLFASALLPAQTWKEYRPEGGGYRVELPGTPAVKVIDVPTKLGNIQMTTAAVELEGSAFMVMLNDYPAGSAAQAGAELMLDGARDGQVRSNPQNVLRSERHITVGGNPCRVLVIDGANHLTFITRLLLVGDRMYQVMYGGPRGTETSADATRFLESFALTSR